MGTVAQLKFNLRKEMKQILMNVNAASNQEQSLNIVKQVLGCSKFQLSSRIGIYLSLPEEVNTQDIVRNILTAGKECFIPKYNKLGMKLVKLHSLEDLESLPETSWKIKQPLETEDREDAFLKGGLDYIIVPGLAFTKEGVRLGRGKGYYDRYLKELSLLHQEIHIKPPFIAGLALMEQIIDHIPSSENDFKVDKVFYPI